MDSEIFSLKF